jgi:hypothetical protein
METPPTSPPQNPPQLPGPTASVPQKTRRISGRAQSYQVQQLTFDCLMAMKEVLGKDGEMKVTREEATAVAQLVRAWESAQERVRIHRGRPLPGTLRPKAKAKENDYRQPEPLDPV